ncbi:MAG: glucosamine-6-phosphate deaminase [Phycisphaerae bacterium]|nr:glucosamine-6-phosphate deaminase [Phycisphaerae bacterium]
MPELHRFPLGRRRRRTDESHACHAIVHDSAASASIAVAHEMAELIREKSDQGRFAVLGLATGSTPVGVYEELVRLHRNEGLSFRNVITFNLDEYWPMRPEALQSYRRYMSECLFDLVDIDPENVHVPDGTLAFDQVAMECERYERQIAEAGGIDLQILGIGRTGHIGFNEPGSGRESRTRLITLDKVTRMDAASDFFGEWNVPRRAITMGVGTILNSHRVILLAFGEGKANIVRLAVEGDVSDAVAASFLQDHPNACFVLDPAAAGELTPIKTPWLLGPLATSRQSWDGFTTRRAVIWLATKLGKPILKLVEEDYNEHGLQDLLSARGSAYDVNIDVFKSLQRTITGWPGGKSTAERVAADTRGDHGPSTPLQTLPPSDGVITVGAPSTPEPFPKRVVVFSPHPDDDVISMGGTLIRLCEQGHEVHVAYQTSGNIAVFDEKAVRHADFVAEFARTFGLFSEREIERIEVAVENFVASKRPGDVDSPVLRQIKGIIRRSEARAAARYAGVSGDRIHFLDLPFYETGRVRKQPLGEEDIAIVMALLDQVQPHQIYAAGDLSDPHGTHRVCLAAIQSAVGRLAERNWMKACRVWLYRGAWQEWEPHQIEMAVPLSPDEVDRKRMAIFHHESQKDKALFPGPSDPREFWQRAEDRNAATAAIFDRLGLPEYQAIEAFVEWRPERG